MTLRFRKALWASEARMPQDSNGVQFSTRLLVPQNA